MVMDLYELRKIGLNEKSKALTVDECDILSLIKMTKTRNRTLHRRLLKWFTEVNKEGLKKQGKQGKNLLWGLEHILDGLEDIF